MNKSFLLSGGRKNDRFESGFKPATLPDLQNGNVNPLQWEEIMDRLLRALSVSERGIGGLTKSDKACCLMEWNDEPEHSFRDIREALDVADI
jgi:hypothetical protein